MNLSDDKIYKALAKQLAADEILRGELSNRSDYISVSDVAKKLKCSKDNVYKLPIQQYTLPWANGRRWKESEVEVYMQTRKVSFRVA